MQPQNKISDHNRDPPSSFPLQTTSSTTTRDLSPATMTTAVFFPLALFFSSDGALSLSGSPGEQTFSINYKWHASSSHKEQIALFNQYYGVPPSRFAHDEIKLRDRCTRNGVTYIPPRTTDSVEQTQARRYTMNRALKTLAQKRKRENMSDVDRAIAIDGDIIRRRKRQLKESSEDRQDRLKREAAIERARRERAFEGECKEQDVQYTSPKNITNETPQMRRARRKKIRKSFTKQQQPKRKQKRITVRKCVYEYNVYGRKAVSCNCNQPPTKKKFAIMGNGGSKYASAITSSCKYIGTSAALGSKNTCYHERYKTNYIQL